MTIMSPSSFTERLIDALNAFFEGIMRFLPGLLAAILIVFLGAAIGWVAKYVVRRLLFLARCDRFCDSVGLRQLLQRADVTATPSALVGSLIFWLVFVSFLMAGLSALHVEVINRLISEFFLYLPRILAALLILLVGFLAGNFLSRAALLAAVNANLPSPRVLALLVKFLVTVLAFAMALEQLEIATSIVLAAFVISFGAVMLGLALAFGIGGREVARRVLERQLGDDRRAEQGDDLQHL